MIRDEIMRLDGFELRKQVAQVLGYRVRGAYETIDCSVPENTFPEYFLFDPHGKTVGGWHYDPERCWEEAPAFERHIGLAWPLLEEIRKTYRIEGDPVSVVVSLYNDGSYRVAVGRYSFDPLGIVVQGEDLAPTICRAYLLAKGASK